MSWRKVNVNKMPVTTRSKRATIDLDDVSEKPKKKMMRLIDITNTNKSSQKSIEKSKLAAQKSDSVLYTSKCGNILTKNKSFTQPTIKRQASTANLSQQAIKHALNVMKKVKNVLGIQFKDIAGRLQLDKIPKCLYDINSCHQNHSSANRPRKISKEDLFIAKLYLTEERHFQFIQFVQRHLISQRIFPGSEIMTDIITEIMKYKSKDKQLSTTFLLSELYNVFITILNTFPPCYIQESYLKIFTSHVKIKGLSSKKQILTSLVDTLHDMIYVKDDQLDMSVNLDFNKNFFMWDKQSSENSSFESFSRNTRFERIFMVLDLLVGILEYDTAVYLTKYSHKFASTIIKTDIKPLVCSVIWNGYKDLMNINSVKKIMSIYVSMVALKYPTDKLRIISRILNLIFNFINLFEYPDSPFQYPVYNKNSTVNFVNEMQKIVENSGYYSIDLLIDVIENMRSPLVRMLLVNQLYTKIVGQNLPISLSVPFKAVYNKDFFKFNKIPNKSNETKNPEKYPKHEKSANSSKGCKIDQDNFIRILMVYSDAVIHSFHLNEIVKEITTGDCLEECPTMDIEMKIRPKKFDSKKFTIAVKNVDLDERVVLRTVDYDYQMNAHIRLSKENCMFYKNEINNFPLINKLIKRCQQKYGEQFDEWWERLENFEQNV